MVNRKQLLSQYQVYREKVGQRDYVGWLEMQVGLYQQAADMNHDLYVAEAEKFRSIAGILATVQFSIAMGQYETASKLLMHFAVWN